MKVKLLEQGQLEQVKGVINCSDQLENSQVAERIAKSAEEKLKELNCPTNIRIDYANSLCAGGELVLWTVFSQNGDVNFCNPVILGGDALAEKNKSSEEVGKEAAKELISEIKSGCCVDKHLGDQLLMFMALLPDSRIQVSDITEHTLTNVYVIEKFLDVKFKVEGKVVSVEEK